MDLQITVQQNSDSSAYVYDLAFEIQETHEAPSIRSSGIESFHRFYLNSASSDYLTELAIQLITQAGYKSVHRILYIFIQWLNVQIFFFIIALNSHGYLFFSLKYHLKFISLTLRRGQQVDLSVYMSANCYSIFTVHLIH